MSSDVYSYCKLCQINHTLQRKHFFTKKHKQRLKTVLQKYGQKIKECRPYLNDPVLQEGNFEPNASFWCHCCHKSFAKHVTDHFKTILYGGVIEHLATEEHWTCTEIFFEENGADNKFKISFIISQTDINLYKSKLEPLVDVYNCRKEKKTETIAKQITSQELARKLIVNTAGPSTLPDVIQYKTVKNKHGIVQNPSGYHDNVRVWKGGIAKYHVQIHSPKYPLKRSIHHRNTKHYTVSAESDGLTSVSLSFDSRKGNIHSGATPPWLRQPGGASSLSLETRMYGPSLKDLQVHQKAKEKSKLNPKRVGANFDHTVSSERRDEDWLPSFGRVWNQGARWKSRHEYRREATNTESKKPRTK